MPSNILQSIVEITAQSDIDALDCCLLNNLSDLYPGINFSILKLIDKDMSTRKYERVKFLSFMTRSECTNTDLINRHVIEVSPQHPALKSIIDNAIGIHTSDSHNQLIFPLSISQNLFGALMIESQNQLPEPPEFSDFITIYQNIYYILNESERDKLTGLFNRRTFEFKVNRLLNLQEHLHETYSNSSFSHEHRAIHQKEFAWLAILDIDHFKSVNDNHGHIIGDEVLLRLSQLMMSSFRRSDLLFRFGGEEFVVILEPTDIQNAFNVLNRFRESLSSVDFPQVGQITISTGFTKISISDYPTDILDKADQALYFSKNNGRNQVQQYEKLIEDNLIAAEPEKPEGEIDLF